MVMVREVGGDEWELLRDVRLAALLDAPYAFGSTYAREAPFTEEQWRGRLAARAVNFFAYAEHAGAGPAAADWAKSRDHDTLYLWVAEVNPAARKLYDRCGFTPTGETQPFPNDRSRLEVRMSRALA